MDKFNNNILSELQKEGRMSNIQLAERVGLSPSACLRRVQELEQSGYILGYRAIINNKKLGLGFVAYVSVGLKTHVKQAQRNFEAVMDQAAEVLECHNVTGSFEHILRVETEDLTSYKKFHTDVLGDLPQVATISTHVVMESSKDSRS